MSVFAKVQKSFIVKFFRKILRITVINPENEPDDEKAYIVCTNHSSNWDPIVLGSSTSRPIRYMAKAELFKVPLLNFIIKLFGAYPVDRKSADISSIKTTIKILGGGEIAGLYPQGRRAKKIHPSKAVLKNGIAMIASRAKVGILPVSIITKGYKVRLFHKTVVVIGKFIPYEQIKAEFESITAEEGEKRISTTDAYRNITNNVYNVILENYDKYDALNKR